MTLSQIPYKEILCLLAPAVHGSLDTKSSWTRLAAALAAIIFLSFHVWWKNDWDVPIYKFADAVNLPFKQQGQI